MIPAPEVSVVIPTRDRSGLLALTLASALAQKDVRHEVLVVDDGSRDATPASLGRITDPRLRVIRHARSMGVARARNSGVEHARGSWIAFLDDDDLWAPDKLARQLSAARASAADFAYSAAVTFAGGAVVQVLAPPDPSNVLRELMPGNVIPAGASNILARTELVRRLGAFDASLDHFADWDLWIRMAREARAAVCPDVHVAYRLHDDSMLLHNWEPVRREFTRVVAKHDPTPDPRMQSVRYAGLAAWEAWGHRRAGRRARAVRLYLASGVRYRNRGNLARALGAMMGERAMTVGGRLRRSGFRRAPRAAPPSWLEPYL